MLEARGASMPTPIPSPILYLERLPQVQRRFQLFADRVEVEARWTLGRKARTIVKLADLSDQPARFTIRNKWFKNAILVGALAVGLAMLVSRSTSPAQLRWLAYLAWPVAGVALVVAMRSFQKQPFAHFPRKNGKPGLDICGTDPHQFGPFLQALQDRIRRA